MPQNHASKKPAGNNRTLCLSAEERARLRPRLVTGAQLGALSAVANRTVWGDMFAALPRLPAASIDLLIIDPPYNLHKAFGARQFKQQTSAAYSAWVLSWCRLLPRLLKPDASVYICCDWRSSFSIFTAASEFFEVLNRITWEREKGRGAKSNWKNCSEDIWFFVNGKNYTFNADAVRSKRRVLAPYRNNGQPKGWGQETDGNFRLTAPSNLWTDITIPFWSMPENTDHPTQKPEKLIAKLILASSNQGDMVLDPFLGSGTTSVVCKKLNRQYIGIEQDEEFCLLAEKRLEMAAADRSIQGLQNGIFWERNTLAWQAKQGGRPLAAKTGNGKKETARYQSQLF